MNSELILAFHSAFSQSESESIRENVSRGLRMAYAQGTITLPATAYGFRKGEDNSIAIDPEQAQVVRSIYQMFLDGHGLRAIKERLEARQIPSPKGKEQWSVATIRAILSNEKYKGDVLLQKTYRPSLFSEKAVVNRGELAKYYIAGALPQIVESQMFDRAQEELAKRVSKRPASEKAKTPFGKYSGKYALTGVVVCGQCGAFYRRITWRHHGKVQVVWRCGARQDKASNCPDSPTLEENKLQSAVMEAISQQYLLKGETLDVTMQSIRSVLTPETAGSEYAIRTKISELQNEAESPPHQSSGGKTMTASTTSNFSASSVNWSSSKPSWRGCRPLRNPRLLTKPGWRRSPPCWNSSRKAAFPSTTSWSARWWTPCGWSRRKSWKSRSRMGTGGWSIFRNRTGISTDPCPVFYDSD